MRLVLIDAEPLFGVGLAHSLSASSHEHRMHYFSSVDELLQCQTPAADAADALIIDACVLSANPAPLIKTLAERLGKAPILVVVRAASEEQQLRNMPVSTIPRTLPPNAFLSKLQQLVTKREELKPCFDNVPDIQQSISPRQREVLSLIACGESNKRIAATLNISERTVKLHITAIFASLGARNRTQALVRALQRGLLPTEVVCPADQATRQQTEEQVREASRSCFGSGALDLLWQLDGLAASSVMR